MAMCHFTVKCEEGVGPGASGGHDHMAVPFSDQECYLPRIGYHKEVMEKSNDDDLHNSDHDN